MSATILDGKATASAIKSELKVIVDAMQAKPGLGTILVGDDPGSHSYVGGKHRDCAEVGINSIRIDMPASSTEAACSLATSIRSIRPSTKASLVSASTIE